MRRESTRMLRKRVRKIVQCYHALWEAQVELNFALGFDSVDVDELPAITLSSSRDLLSEVTDKDCDSVIRETEEYFRNL